MRIGDILVRDVVVEIEEVELFIIVAVELGAQELHDLKVVTLPDLAAYERIEVVKGPSSVLYGRGSAGGLVNRVRKKPLPVFASELDAFVGSFDFYRAEGDVTGPLFESERARGRLVLAYQDAGSFVDGVESERVVAAPSLDFDLTASTRLLLLGSYQRDEFLPNSGFPLVRDGNTLRAPDIRRSLFPGVPNERENNIDVLAGIAQLEQDLGDQWLVTLRLNRTDIRRRQEAENYAIAFEDGLIPGDGNVLLNSLFAQSGRRCLVRRIAAQRQRRAAGPADEPHLRR